MKSVAENSSSVGVEWAGERLAALLKPGQLVIAIAKGVRAEKNGDLRILPDVLARPVPARVRERVGWAAIIGPSIAGDFQKLVADYIEQRFGQGGKAAAE